MYLPRFKPGKSQSDIDRVLRFVIRSAADHIPAYRRLLDQVGASPSHIKRSADLPELPIMTKQAMFLDGSALDQLQDNADPARLFRTCTSGSTGLPVTIYMNKAEALFRRFQLLAAWRGLAQLPWLFRVADFGTWVSEGIGHVSAQHGPASIVRISLSLPLDQQVHLLKEYAPHVISGTPTVLDLLARHLEESPVALGFVPLVATRGEVLFAPVRAKLERAFGCRVADLYNCEEIGHVASECPADANTFHINTDACVVEVVDNEGQPLPSAEEGRILLTNLYNCTMPFIRYDIGDRGTLIPTDDVRPCTCGSRRPRMKLLGQREDDYIFLPDGRRMSPRLVGTAVYRAAMVPLSNGNLGWLFHGFQIVQDELDHMTVRIVTEPNQSIDLEDLMARTLRDLHPSYRCTVEFVDSFQLEPSGKFKKVICTISTQK